MLALALGGVSADMGGIVSGFAESGPHGIEVELEVDDVVDGGGDGFDGDEAAGTGLEMTRALVTAPDAGSSEFAGPEGDPEVGSVHDSTLDWQIESASGEAW